MPPLETVGLVEKTILWEAAGTDAYGEPLVLAPVEIDVRWTGRTGAAPGPQGGSETADATATVDRPVPEESILWRGALEDWDPSRPQPLMRVTGYEETPDVKGRFTARRVLLRRYKGSLPAVVG
jgi:hypothetical protein